MCRHARRPATARQRRALDYWREGAADRDTSVVEIVVDTVTGATDPAPTPRQRYLLPAGRFAPILVGKYGMSPSARRPS